MISHCSQQSANEWTVDRSVHLQRNIINCQPRVQLLRNRKSHTQIAINIVMFNIYSFLNFVDRNGSSSKYEFIKILSSALAIVGDCNVKELHRLCIRIRFDLMYFSNSGKCFHGFRVECHEYLCSCNMHKYSIQITQSHRCRNATMNSILWSDIKNVEGKI